MDMLVWIFAGIFLVNVLTVAILGVVVEVRQRRYQREVRDLELLYEAPSARVPVTAPRRRHERPVGKHVVVAVATQGKHVEVEMSDPRGQEMVRSASFVIAVASILVVIIATLVSPTEDADTASMTAADGNTEEGAVPGLRIEPRQGGGGSDRRNVSTDPRQGRAAIDEPIDVDAPGQNVVVSGGEDAIPAVVAAAPASATSIRLDWEPVPAATGYLVDRWMENGADADRGWLEIASTAAGISTITDTDLEAATTYYYRVTAVLEGGVEALASDVVHATTMSAPPQAPTLTVKTAGNNVFLRWTDVEDETGYRIERLASGEDEWALLAATDAGVVSVKDEDLSADVTYEYRVIATGLGGDSEPSNIVQVDPSVSIGEGSPSAEDPGQNAIETDAMGADSIETAAIEADVIETDAMEPVAIEPVAIEPDAVPSD
ncbi:MAG TPA: fibronectin type III domain-containing protein [Actinomycetota bacterium]|nr:fibronectin type III domain-containing protein [Actinomycetota bacterium]